MGTDFLNMKGDFYDCNCFDKNDEPVDRVQLYVPTDTPQEGFEKAVKWLSRFLHIPAAGVHITGVIPAEADGARIRCVFSMLDLVPVSIRRRS